MHTEDFRAFAIPANSRDKYFETVEQAYDLFPKSMKANGDIDCYSDPIVKFHGWTAMGKNCQMWWNVKMRQLGARDVTEQYAGC